MRGFFNHNKLKFVMIKKITLTDYIYYVKLKINKEDDMNKTLSIFACVKNENNKPKIKAIFLEYDFNNAKLWFQGYINGERELAKWLLYKIGEINEDMTLKSYKIYVTTGYQFCKDTNDLKWEQLELYKKAKREKEKIENLKILYKNKADLSEIIREAFDGRVINE